MPKTWLGRHWIYSTKIQERDSDGKIRWKSFRRSFLFKKSLTDIFLLEICRSYFPTLVNCHDCCEYFCHFRSLWNTNASWCWKHGMIVEKSSTQNSEDFELYMCDHTLNCHKEYTITLSSATLLAMELCDPLCTWMVKCDKSWWFFTNHKFNLHQNFRLVLSLKSLFSGVYGKWVLCECTEISGKIYDLEYSQFLEMLGKRGNFANALD